MAETPEEIRARILAEESAKGSDPRVAEARAKAAEARARHGYPIDPQEAWRVKLEKESGKAPSTAPAPAAAAPEPASAAAVPSGSDASAHPAQPLDGDARVPDESPEGPTTSGATEAPAPATSAEAPAAASVPVVEPEPAFEPEVGEVIYSDEVVVLEMAGGIRARDAAVPVWAMVAMLVLSMWAIVYLIGPSGPGAETAATRCAVHEDRTIECFLPEPSEETEAPSGGGH